VAASDGRVRSILRCVRQNTGSGDVYGVGIQLDGTADRIGAVIDREIDVVSAALPGLPVRRPEELRVMPDGKPIGELNVTEPALFSAVS